LAVDFEVGFAIKEKIIPRAVLYFTGEIFDDNDSEASDSEDEDPSEEDAVVLSGSRRSQQRK